LDKAGAGFVEEVAGEEEAVAEIGEVGVDAELPGVAESADHFWLLGEVFVLAILHVAAIDEGLEIGAVADAVGWVDINHLNLTGHALFFEKRVHYEKRITRYEAVGPSVRVAVEVNGFAERRIFFTSLEQVALRGPQRDTIALANGFDDGAWVNALVDVEGNRRDLERQMLFLSGPYKLWVEMRIVFVGLARCNGGIGLRSDQANGRIVCAGFCFVIVLFNRSFVRSFLGFVGGLLLDGHGAYLDLSEDL